MIRLKTDLSRRKAVDQIAKLRAAHTGLADNAAFYTNPTVPLAQVNTEINTAEALMNDITQQEGILAGLRTQRDAALRIARASYTRNAKFVETKAGADRAQGALSGYELMTDTPVAAGPLERVADVALTAGANAGEAAGTCTGQATADGYEAQVSADPPTHWVMYGAFGKAAFTLTGLPSLTKQWLRVRAFRGNQKGPWSDPACAVIP